MFKKARKPADRPQARKQAAAPPQPAAQPASQPSAPRADYASLGPDAPIAWPAASARRVPVTGQLSPHAAAALKRMGITKE